MVLTPLVWSVPLAFNNGGAGDDVPCGRGILWPGLTDTGPVLGFSDGGGTGSVRPRHGPVPEALFVKGLTYFLPELTRSQQWAISLAVMKPSSLIGQSTWSRIGRAACAIVAFVVVNLPFLLLVLFGLPHVTIANWMPEQGSCSALCGRNRSAWPLEHWRLVVVFRSGSGSARLPEKSKACARTIPLATLAAVPLVGVVPNLLPLGVALGAKADWTSSGIASTHTISQIAGEVAGPLAHPAMPGPGDHGQLVEHV